MTSCSRWDLIAGGIKLSEDANKRCFVGMHFSLSEDPAQSVQNQGDDAKDGEAIDALVATVACIAQDVGVGVIVELVVFLQG